MVGLTGSGTGGLAEEISVILINALWDGGGVASGRFGLRGIAISEKYVDNN